MLNCPLVKPSVRRTDIRQIVLGKTSVDKLTWYCKINRRENLKMSIGMLKSKISFLQQHFVVEDKNFIQLSKILFHFLLLFMHFIFNFFNVDFF